VYVYLHMCKYTCASAVLQIPSQQFRRFMHQDPVKVASILFECSQRRWENPPDELLFADCEMPDEASDVVDRTLSTSLMCTLRSS